MLSSVGCQVRVFERNAAVGGAEASADILTNGLIVDLGVAAHPFGVASPMFRHLGLENHGLEWMHSDYPLAHTFDDALEQIMRPLLRFPNRSVRIARFGVLGSAPSSWFVRTAFLEESARALFTGSAASSNSPLGHPFTSTFGVLFSGLGSDRLLASDQGQDKFARCRTGQCDRSTQRRGSYEPRGDRSRRAAACQGDYFPVPAAGRHTVERIPEQSVVRRSPGGPQRIAWSL